MTANLCVESTGRHAAERGYDVTFVRWQAFSDVDGHGGFGQDSFAVGDVNSTGHVAPYGGLPSDPSTRAPSQAQALGERSPDWRKVKCSAWADYAEKRRPLQFRQDNDTG